MGATGSASAAGRLTFRRGLGRSQAWHVESRCIALAEVAPPIEHPLSASPYRSRHRSTGRAGGTRRRLASRESEVAACASFNPEPTATAVQPEHRPSRWHASPVPPGREKGTVVICPNDRSRRPDRPICRKVLDLGRIREYDGGNACVWDTITRLKLLIVGGSVSGRSATWNVGVRAASGWPFWPLFPRR